MIYLTVRLTSALSRNTVTPSMGQEGPITSVFVATMVAVIMGKEVSWTWETDMLASSDMALISSLRTCFLFYKAINCGSQCFYWSCLNSLCFAFALSVPCAETEGYFEEWLFWATGLFYIWPQGYFEKWREIVFWCFGAHLRWAFSRRGFVDLPKSTSKTSFRVLFWAWEWATNLWLMARK